MKTLFNDPVHWTRTAVGSKGRFTVLVLGLSAYTCFAFWLAAHEGLGSAVGSALFVISYQCMLLYALRAMHLRVASQESRPAGAPHGAPHGTQPDSQPGA